MEIFIYINVLTMKREKRENKLKECNKFFLKKTSLTGQIKRGGQRQFFSLLFEEIAARVKKFTFRSGSTRKRGS